MVPFAHARRTAPRAFHRSRPFRPPRCSLLLLAFALSLLPRTLSAQQLPLYRDSMRPLQARVEDLLRRMTLEEKVAQLECMSPRDLDSLFAGGLAATYGPANARFGIGHVCGLGFRTRGGPRDHAAQANRIQRYFLEHTRLGIPVIITEEALHGLVSAGSTNYPTPMALASTFDVDLVHQVFTEVGAEAGAQGTDHVLAPVLDLAQDPRWGRAEETYGEDPYLVSRMGVAAITGFQGPNPLAIGRDHVGATTKHFAGHGAPEGGRNIGPPHMSEHELRDLHFRPFQAAVQEARVLAVMPAYHEILGVPVHASPFMLTQVLRGEWGFPGIVVSDFYGIRYTFDTHLAAPSKAEAARLALIAGVDVDMPQIENYSNLVGLVRQHRLDQRLIDRAVRRVLRAKFVLRLFDHPYVDTAAVDRFVATPAHLATARRAGDEAMTLLKNEGGVLPLDPARLHTIALIGPHADYAERGNYAGFPRASVTPQAAVRARLGPAVHVLYAEGARLTNRPGQLFGPATLADDSTNQRLIREAVAVARQADVVVLALGANAQMMHEAWVDHEGDNDELELRQHQNELVDSIRATGKPFVVLLFSGGPLGFAHVDRTAPVILYCWYLGQETGHAVADVLFGDVDPSGRLPITIPRSTGQLPVYYDRKPSARRQPYAFDASTPLYAFGFGLSYTTFRIANVRLERPSIARTDSVNVLADVTNTGSRPGDEVVQLYIRQDFTIPTRPVKELKDFRRLSLAPGQTKTVALTLTPARLGHVGGDMRFVVEPGTYKVMVGSSSRDQDLATVLLTVR